MLWGAEVRDAPSVTPEGKAELRTTRGWLAAGGHRWMGACFPECGDGCAQPLGGPDLPLPGLSGLGRARAMACEPDSPSSCRRLHPHCLLPPTGGESSPPSSLVHSCSPALPRAPRPHYALGEPQRVSPSIAGEATQPRMTRLRCHLGKGLPRGQGLLVFVGNLSGVTDPWRAALTPVHVPQDRIVDPTVLSSWVMPGKGLTLLWGLPMYPRQCENMKAGP